MTPARATEIENAVLGFLLGAALALMLGYLVVDAHAVVADEVVVTRNGVTTAIHTDAGYDENCWRWYGDVQDPRRMQHVYVCGDPK